MTGPYLDPEPGSGPDPGARPPGRLWAEGSLSLRVAAPGEPPGAGRVVAIDRPYALVGRIAGADVRIDDPAVSARHAYLHLDRRGLYAVDLATRSGTRVGPDGRSAGWLAPGQSLEVAGHRVELLDCRVDAGPDDPAGGGDDPLADAGPGPLMRVTLYPAGEPQAPMVLGSELVFLGRSASCGVRIDADSASRTHCVLARARRGAFVIDLVGRGTWLNGRPLRGAAALADGDSLMVGSARFEVRVEPPWARRLGAALVPAATPPAPSSMMAPAAPTTELLTTLPPPPPGVFGPEAQAAALGWMMQVLQAGQNEIHRQQAEFQQSMAQFVRQMHQDNTALLSRHLERVDAINRELAGLRDEIRHRFGSAEAPAPARPHAPALPPASPLRIAPAAPSADASAATSWLLDRVGKLEQESRSSWKDLLGRLGGPARRPS